jgi:hypothetical protein
MTAISRRTVLAVVAFAASTPTTAGAQLDQLLRGLPGSPGTSASDTRIADGLKEALRIGTAQAVSLTGRVDGYFANQAIRILMPERLRTLESGLRTLGFGAQVDELVLGMNRAAERAAPHAREIFVESISAMTIDDARRILGGAETAATDYFKTKTTPRLTQSFTPIVERSMAEVGVARQYEALRTQAKAIPFFRAEDYDLNQYVVGKGLDGLFFMVGEEERRIRRDPAARVTDLLRDVFGR